ncbi:MAG: FkbM family methyltransferase [Magnetococcales bacterium]|nr:FkbM family methyltransferase [Magnetococcales bacterium]
MPIEPLEVVLSSGVDPVGEASRRLVALFAQNRHQELESLAREMVAGAPEFGFGWKALGVAMQQQGRDAEAVDALARALDSLPGDGELQNNLGYSMQKLGRFDEAEACYRRAVGLQPGEVNAWLNLGFVLLRQGRLDEAGAVYRQALGSCPDVSDLYYNLGMVSSPDEALAAFRDAVRLQPDHVQAWLRLGLLLHRQKRMPEAESALREAIRLGVENGEAHGDLGVLLYECQRLDEAEAAFREAIRRQPDDIASLANLAVLLMERSAPVEAESLLRAALRLRPDDPGLYFKLGSALWGQLRATEALEALRECVRLDPDHAEAHYQLSLFLFYLGRVDEAYRSSDEALRIRPDLDKKVFVDNVKYIDPNDAARQMASVSAEIERACRHVASRALGDPLDLRQELLHLKQCRRGIMLYFRNDRFIGESLERYGAFSEGEVELFSAVVSAGQTVLEVGANIGAHTVWLGQLVGEGGRVIACEPQRLAYRLLEANCRLNRLAWCRPLLLALGSERGAIVVPAVDLRRANNAGGLSLRDGDGVGGEEVPLETVDGLGLEALHFLKVDVEGMELEVLMGARETLRRLRPVLYVENDRVSNSSRLVAWLRSMGYRLYWHKPPLIDLLCSINLLAIPEEAGAHLAKELSDSVGYLTLYA